MLSLGDKFGLPINSTQKTDRMNSTLGITKNFEVMAYRLSDEVLNATRNAIVNMLQNYLLSTNGNLPRCYGVPKIHKPGCLLRIIVSTNDSPLYNLASYLNKILKDSISKPDSFVKDSWSFVDRMKNVSVCPNGLFVSFDATSLFTNIPKELVIKGIEKRWTMISNDKLMTTFDIFNSYHPRLKFTYEVEENGSISFLDTRITNDNGTIITNWYRKPTYIFQRSKAGSPLKLKSDQSVVSKHRLTFNHEFDWSDPDVLHRDAFNRRREIAEMYFIKKQDRPVNLQKDTDSLP
ncbi:hypothetical protein X777_04043, partial [Ooceraea biroi]